MREVDPKDAWQVRLGNRTLARLVDTYLNWPWVECTVVGPSDYEFLDPLLRFGEDVRSGALEPLSSDWEIARVALFDRGFSLSAPSSYPDGELPEGVTGFLLLLRRDGTALVRYSSTPNVRISPSPAKLG